MLHCILIVLVSHDIIEVHITSQFKVIAIDATDNFTVLFGQGRLGNRTSLAVDVRAVNADSLTLGCIPKNCYTEMQ